TAPDSYEILEHRGQERIVPARHEQHGRLEPFGARITVDPTPVSIALRMVDPVVEKRNVGGRAVIRVAEREAGDTTVDHLRRRRIVLTPTTAERPVQRALQRKRPAGVEHPVKIRTADLNEQRSGAGIRLIGYNSLRVPEVGATPHSNMAVIPGLL